MKHVVITVVGGVLEVVKKSADVSVVIRDYDIGGTFENFLLDECGTPYILTTHTPDEEI